MILKKRKCLRCKKECEKNCNCKSTPTTKRRMNNYDDQAENFVIDTQFNYNNEAENFDDEAPTFSGMTLEENFENFGEAVVETAENFIPLVAGLVARKKYKASPVGQARQQAKIERIQARQEKRLSRIKGGQAVREARQQQKVEGALASIRNLNAPLEAEQQAQQVNQLQSQVQPEARAVMPQQVPQGGGQDSTPSFATLPMPSDNKAFPTGLTGMSGGSMDSLQEQPTEATPQTETQKAAIEKIKEATTEAPKKKKNNVLFIGVALAVVVGAIYFLRKKKIV